MRRNIFVNEAFKACLLLSHQSSKSIFSLNLRSIFLVFFICWSSGRGCRARARWGNGRGYWPSAHQLISLRLTLKSIPVISSSVPFINDATSKLGQDPVKGPTGGRMRLARVSRAFHTKHHPLSLLFFNCLEKRDGTDGSRRKGELPHSCERWTRCPACELIPSPHIQSSWRIAATTAPGFRCAFAWPAVSSKV